MSLSYLTSKTQKIDKQKPKKAVKCFKNETSHRFYFANINFFIRLYEVF